MIAFVEISYSSDAASFGGFAQGRTMHADVIEVESENESEARKKATEKFKSLDTCGMTTVRGCRFLRWLKSENSEQ